MAAALAGLLVLIPVYRVRDRRYVEPARVSARTMQAVASDAPTLPPDGTIVFEDEAVPFSNFRSAFGSLATDAVRLYVGPDVTAQVVPAGGSAFRAGTPVIARYRLDHGRVSRVEPPDDH